MAINEVAKAIVDVDGQQAGQELKKLENRAKDLRSELVKLAKENDLAGFRKTEKDLKAVNTAMRNLQKETFDVEKVLKRLNGASFNDLTKAQRLLRSEIKGMNRETKEENRLYTEKVAKLKLVDIELGKVKNEMYAVERAQRSWMGSAKGSFTKMAGWITGITATITGISYSFKRSIDASNEFHDSLANLSALTGLQGKDLDWLSEQAKKFSVSTTESGIRIRQSAKDILDAYTVMGSQRPELLKDKEALAQVTEQAIILSEAGKIELEPAVAALANTLNQFNLSGEQASRVVNVIAAGSKAGAADIDYVSTAIEKAGTTASLMGISVEQAVGVIETVGPKFAEATTAGNSLDKVLLKMSEKQIGYKDGVFDLSLALDQLAVMFDNGKSASSIFGVEHAKMAEVLVQGRDDFRKYTAEVTGTSVAIEQAAINTDTNSAKLAQAKNRMNLVAVELGESVSPAYTAATNTLAGFLKAMLTIAKTLFEYRNYLIIGTSAIVAYTLVVNGAAIATRLYSAVTKVAELATKAFNTTMKSNPWGLVASLIASAVTALIVFSREMRTTSSEVKAQTRLNNALAESISKELGPMTQAFDKLKGLNESSGERSELIKQINEQYGQYLPSLLTEKSSLQEIEAAQSSANKALEESIGKKVRAQVLEEVITEKIRKQIELEGLRKAEIEKTGFDPTESMINEARYAQEIIDKNYQDELAKAGLQGKKKEDLKGKQLETFLQLEEQYNTNVKNLRDEALNVGTYDTSDMAKLRKEIKDLADQAYFLDQIIKESTGSTGTSGGKKPNTKPGSGQIIATGEGDDNKKLEDELKRQAEYRQQIINESKSLIEQENIAYQERLKNAGIFDKEKETMSAEELQAQEILLNQHIENIKKINDGYAREDLADLQSQFDQETLIRQTAHNNEMALLGKDAEAKKKLDEQFKKEEIDRNINHLQDLMAKLQGALQGEDTLPSVDELLLTDAEKEALKAKIAELGLALSELGIKKAELSGDAGAKSGFQKFLGGDSGDKVDIFGMSGADWKQLISNIQEGNIALEDTERIANALIDIWSQYYQIKNNLEQQDLQRYEQNIESQKAALKDKLDKGLISQEQYNSQIGTMDESLDTKRKAIALKAAKRERNIALMNAIVNTAAGIVKMLANPFPLNLILAALVGVMGGLQIAAIASTPLPQAYSGKYDVIGAQDGKKYRAGVKDSPRTGLINEPTILVGEKPEIIIDPPTTRNLQINYPEVIDAINWARTPQYFSGKYPQWNSTTTKETTERALPSEFYETISGLKSVLQSMTEKGINAKLYADGEYVRAHNKVTEEYENLRKQTSLRE